MTVSPPRDRPVNRAGPRLVLLGVLAVLGVHLAGCGTGAGRPAGSEVVAETSVRTDREPIASRFPVLGAFHEVRWTGGTLGDGRVPGPSTYVIEAVLSLAPEDVARLRTAFAFEPAPAPDVGEPLRAGVGDAGVWSRSPALDSALGSTTWAARLTVQLDNGVAHLSARGE